MKHFRQIGCVPAEQFGHSIEQLRRLHTIARSEISSELNALVTNSRDQLLTIFTVVLLLGSFVVWKILREDSTPCGCPQETESLLRQSATFFESASEGVVITDTDAKITAVNRAFTISQVT